MTYEIRYNLMYIVYFTIENIYYFSSLFMQSTEPHLMFESYPFKRRLKLVHLTLRLSLKFRFIGFNILG